MPFDQVVDVIQDAFGCPWQEEFQSIEEKPLGSASIAQVHRAVLKSGEQVVIKCSAQRYLQAPWPEISD